MAVCVPLLCLSLGFHPIQPYCMPNIIFVLRKKSSNYWSGAEISKMLRRAQLHLPNTLRELSMWTNRKPSASLILSQPLHHHCHPPQSQRSQSRAASTIFSKSSSSARAIKSYLKELCTMLASGMHVNCHSYCCYARFSLLLVCDNVLY